MILSPFAPLPQREDDNAKLGVGQMQAPSVRTFLEYSDPDRGKSIRLSTAVGMGARFPFIFGPATIPLGTSQVQFVDGGYYDNTGVNSAALIHAHLTDVAMRQRDGAPPAKFQVFLISIGTFDSRTDELIDSFFSDLPCRYCLSTTHAGPEQRIRALRFARAAFPTSISCLRRTMKRFHWGSWSANQRQAA